MEISGYSFVAVCRAQCIDRLGVWWLSESHLGFSSVVLHPLDKLYDYSVGVRDLEEPLSPRLSLDRRRDLHALPLQARVLPVDVVYDEDDEQPVRVPPAQAVGLEAFQACAQINEVEAGITS